MLHCGSNCSLAQAMDGHTMPCGIISSCQSAVTSKTVKCSRARVHCVAVLYQVLDFYLVARISGLWWTDATVCHFLLRLLSYFHPVKTSLLEWLDGMKAEISPVLTSISGCCFPIGHCNFVDSECDQPQPMWQVRCYYVYTSVCSALEVFTLMQYITLRFTYLPTLHYITSWIFNMA